MLKEEYQLVDHGREVNRALGRKEDTTKGVRSVGPLMALLPAPSKVEGHLASWKWWVNGVVMSIMSL